MTETKCKAQIYRSSQRTFDCKVFSSGEMVEATSLANLLKEGDIVVGDWVFLEKGTQNENIIVAVEERKNLIFRMIPRESKHKIIAANCDVVVVVVSVSFPLYKRGLVDRYLVRAQQWGIPVMVVFNKIDEWEGYKKKKNVFDLNFEAKRLHPLDISCFALSAINPQSMLEKGVSVEMGNFQDFKRTLQGKTAVFLGQSGVGKSRLISTLTEGKVQLLSGELGKVQKGAHTTTWAELVDCGDFQVIDSPGIRSFSLEDIKKEELIDYFPDLAEQATLCRFRSCTHEKQSKGCSFYESVAANEAEMNSEEREILLSRLESYHQILKEVSERPSWEKNSF